MKWEVPIIHGLKIIWVIGFFVNPTYRSYNPTYNWVLGPTLSPRFRPLQRCTQAPRRKTPSMKPSSCGWRIGHTSGTALRSHGIPLPLRYPTRFTCKAIKLLKVQGHSLPPFVAWHVASGWNNSKPAKSVVIFEQSGVGWLVGPSKLYRNGVRTKQWLKGRISMHLRIEAHLTLLNTWFFSQMATRTQLLRSLKKMPPTSPQGIP